MMQNCEECPVHQCHAALQRTHNRLEKWAGRYLVRFSAGMCKVWPLGKNSPKHQDTLRVTQLVRSLADKDPRVSVETKLNVSAERARRRGANWAALGVLPAGRGR